MAKQETPWFKHDYNARRDPKMIRLQRIKGMKGLGIYWALVEILHEQGGEIKMEEIPDIAHELREDENNILSVIKEFDLFDIEENEIFNKRVKKSLKNRVKKSKNAKLSAKKRWEAKAAQQTDNKEVNIGEKMDAIALRSQCQKDAIRVDKSRVDKNTIIDAKASILTPFENFRVLFPGKKRGYPTEIANFKKKHRDWAAVIELLYPAVQNQLAARAKDAEAKRFVPQWKNMQTWINQRCWEEITGNEGSREAAVKSLAPDTNAFFNVGT